MMIDSLLKHKPTPKRLILSLLSAPTMGEIRVGHFIEWARLFGIEDAATRVAVGRLVKQGFIQTVARGTYSIGPEGRLIAETASRWVHAEERVGTWCGDWLVAHTSHLGRTNKTTLRARERAFRLNGFAEFVTGLWCRPGNYVEPLSSTRDRLISLGLEPDAVVMRVSEIPGVEDTDLFRLWPRRQIEAGYRDYIEAMKRSTARIGSLSIEDAARETFLVGEAVIRQINSDPLLPDSMVDAPARQRMVQHMVDYNESGRSAWARFQAIVV